MSLPLPQDVDEWVKEILWLHREQNISFPTRLTLANPVKSGSDGGEEKAKTVPAKEAKEFSRGRFLDAVNIGPKGGGAEYAQEHSV